MKVGGRRSAEVMQAIAEASDRLRLSRGAAASRRTDRSQPLRQRGWRLEAGRDRKEQGTERRNRRIETGGLLNDESDDN